MPRQSRYNSAGLPTDPESPKDSAQWWLVEDEDVHDSLMSRSMHLRERQRARRTRYRYLSQFYGVNEFLSLGLTTYEPQHVDWVAPSQPYNVCRRAVSTVLAKITQHKPLPLVLTERGDYTQTRRARGLSNFLGGAFAPEACNVFRKTENLCRDALVYGTGVLKIYHWPGDKLPRLDRVLPWQIYTEVADAYEGEPSLMYTVRWYDRGVLAELFPKQKEAIERASSSSAFLDDIPDYDSTNNKILVTEAWRLPTRDGGTPGRHAIAIDGATLFVEEWTKTHFPFVFLTYATPLLGFFGEGLVDETAGFQVEVSYTVETLRMAHRVVGTGIWLVPDGSDIVDSHFDNEVGTILKYRPGFKPDHINPDAASPQTYQYLQQTAEDALKWVGIGTMAAHGQAQPGITAAKAIETLDDIESDNFALFEDRWEQVHVEIGSRLIDEFKELAEENPNLKVFRSDRKSLLSVKWKDVDMARDAISMQVWPISLMGRTPAARLQMVNDLFNGGIIDRSLYLKLLDAPDIDAETDLDAAAREICDAQIEAMLDLDVEDVGKPGAYKRPWPFQDLVYALHRAQQHINLGQLTGVPMEILELLMTYIEDCKAELQKRNGMGLDQQPSPTQQAAPGAGPTPPGAPPPMNGAAAAPPMAA